MSQNDYITFANKIRKAWTQKESFIFPSMTIADLSCILEILNLSDADITEQPDDFTI